MPRQPRPALTISIPRTFSVSSLPSTAGLMDDNLKGSDSESDYSDVSRSPTVEQPRTQALARSVTLNSIVTSSERKTKPLQRSSSTRIRQSPYDRATPKALASMGKTIYTPWGFSMPATPTTLPTRPSIEEMEEFNLPSIFADHSPISISSSPKRLTRSPKSARSPSRSPRSSRTARTPPSPRARSPCSCHENDVTTASSDACSTAPTTPISPTFSAVSAVSSQTSIASISSVLSEKTTTDYFDSRP